MLSPVGFEIAVVDEVGDERADHTRQDEEGADQHGHQAEPPRERVRRRPEKGNRRRDQPPELHEQQCREQGRTAESEREPTRRRAGLWIGESGVAVERHSDHSG